MNDDKVYDKPFAKFYPILLANDEPKCSPDTECNET